MINISLIVIHVKYSATSFPQVQIHRLLKWKSKYILLSATQHLGKFQSLFQQCPSKCLIMSDTSGFNYIPVFFRADIQLQDVLEQVVFSWMVTKSHWWQQYSAPCIQGMWQCQEIL